MVLIKSNFIAKKYCRVIECFAKKMGISDMHCMSDEYLAEELEIAYNQRRCLSEIMG